MKESICNYIEYLGESHGLKISLHGEGIRRFLDFLAPYNAHECAYCMYVKSSAECWQRCREGQRRAEAHLAENGEYFGSCYAGVGEFVFPITAFDKNVGMISVGAYIGNAEKRSKFCAEYGFHEAKMSSLAHSELKEEVPDFKFIKTLIDPLSAMLTLMIERCGGEVGAESIYGKILSIIHTGYMKKLSISDIAAKCHYSPSFLTRHFKEKSGKTINEYIFSVRIKKAAELLLGSDMRIEDVAASTGFFDTNYFISCFSKKYGIPPKKYRNANKR